MVPVAVKNSENLSAQGDAPALITIEDFKSQVMDSEQPVLVEFWATWSPACQVMDSVLEQVTLACAGKLKLVKVNADDNLDLSLWYEIRSIPTLLYFVRGHPSQRIVGTASKEAILAKINLL